MFIDIFQAQGIFGISFFVFLFIILFLNSSNTSLNKIKASIDLRSISVVGLFFILCTHNSGILFHPLTIFPLLYVQDFVDDKNFIKL